MLDRNQSKLINQWTDGYEHLSLLSILAKISLLNLINPSKPFKVVLLSDALNLEKLALLRIFHGLESMGLCDVSKDKILLTNFARSFLANKAATLKVIISSDRWAPHWLGLSSPEKLAYPIASMLNKQYKTHNYLIAILNEWFSEELSKYNKEIISQISFKGVNSIADVGGGHGQLVRTILKKNKKLLGTVFDKIYGKKTNPVIYSETEIEKRITRIKCNFFKKMKINADLIFLKSVLHNWNDTEALKILKNLYFSIPFESKLFIIERIFRDPDSFIADKKMIMLDLRMFFIHSGKERSLGDLKKLIKSAGFQLAKKIETKNGFYILEVIKSK